MNFRIRWIWCFFFLLPLWVAFAGGNPEKSQTPFEDAGHVQPVINAQGEASLPVEAPTRAETVLRALASAYPDRTGEIEFLDGDWTIQIYGERFYFAGGRFLPAPLRDRMSEYAPLPFYNYIKELPPWNPPTAEESARMRENSRLRETRQVMRSTHFYDALWRTRNRDEAWEHVKQIRFLGHNVQVHYSILVDLSLVEQTILRSAKTNAAVRQWIDSIASVDGWNWRNIASSESRSFHAYGAAIDILPKSLRGLETYWLWTARHTPEWWTVPYSKRFHPPEEVLKAFEAFGFIWGGKWLFYDTMHFEYRPEILTLSGIGRMDKRELR